MCDSDTPVLLVVYNASVDDLFIIFCNHSRAGNLIIPNLGAEVTSDVTSSSGPVKLEDLQRILSNIGPAGTKLFP